RIVGASIVFSHSILEFNTNMGIRMEHSTSTIISDSFIREHRDTTNTTLYGIFLFSGSTPAISNTRFTNNETPISADGTSWYNDGGGNVFDP
ncbi:MAG: hypothetical protein WAP52_00460, partial [Candidatus Sungiibacteriota bacterium]